MDEITERLDRITDRLDKMVSLLERIGRSPSIVSQISGAAATGIGILGILSIVDVIKNWLGG